MALIDSLLTAILRHDGESLVLHVGDKPCVVAGAGMIELSERTLTFDVLTGMLGDLLPEMGQTEFVQWKAKGASVPPDWGAAKERVRELQT